MADDLWWVETNAASTSSGKQLVVLSVTAAKKNANKDVKQTKNAFMAVQMRAKGKMC